MSDQRDDQRGEDQRGADQRGADQQRDRYPDDLGTRRLGNDDPRDDMTLDDVFEAFNAEEVIEDPGVPAEDRSEPMSPVRDSDAPAPG